MFKNNALKKVSIVVASLALILPLVSVGNSSTASAKARKPRAVRVVKHFNESKRVGEKMDNNGNVHGHHYYKFAYNRREYRKARKYIVAHRLGVKKLNRKFNVSRKSRAYRYGFNDSLNNTQHRAFVNAKQYEQGYLTADAYTIDAKVNKKTLNSGKRWFKMFKADGPATAPAIDQIKWEAHIDTL